MPSAARHRERGYAVVAGNATWADGLLGPATSSFTVSETCDDTHGFRDQVNYFLLRRSTTKFWTLNGVSHPDGWTYHNYVMYGNPAAHQSPSTYEPTLNELVTRGIHLTSPNKSHVDLPVFIAELRDIPKTYKFLSEMAAELHGRKTVGRILQNAGNAHLTHQFGLEPFVRDMWRIMTFVNVTEARFRDIKAIQSSPRGKGRMRVVWRDKRSMGTFTQYASPLYSENNILEVSWFTSREKRFACRWTASPETFSWSDDELRFRANRIVFGFDTSMSNLWQAMPWTWLADWFGNTGDYLTKNRNTFPCQPDRMCAMQRMVTGIDSTRVISGSGLHTLKAKPNQELRVELLRIPISEPPPPESHFGASFLSPRQLSILGALTVSRRKPALSSFTL